MTTNTKRLITIAAAITAGLSLLVLGLNFLPQRKVDAALGEDARNEGIEIDVHYGNYVEPDTLVYSIEEVDSDTAAIDVFRAFLQSAEALRDSQFDAVQLAYKGDVRFVLDGREFQTMGEDYDYQNPIYTIRTFPEKLETPDGQDAYGQWTGGVLGVLNKQMDDFNDAMKTWYGADEVSRLAEDANL